WPDDRKAIFVPFIISFLPMFYSTIARISNDSLAVLLFSPMVLAVLRQQPARIGILLGLGLLTKAYFLVAIPAIVVALLASASREKQKMAVSQLAIILLTGAIISGWWYVRNYAVYGNLSGMQEVT